METVAYAATTTMNTMPATWVKYSDTAGNHYEHKQLVPFTFPHGIGVYSGGNMAKANDREYAVIDLDTGNCIGSAKALDEANRLAASAAGRTDHRVVVFKPVALHEPKKDTVKTDIALEG